MRIQHPEPNSFTLTAALAGMPPANMEEPRGIVRVQIDPNSGDRAAPGQENAISELFRSENVPEQTAGNGLQGGSDDANLPRNLF